MSIYSVYATTDELAVYLGIAEEALPENAVRMLARASDLVTYLMGSNYLSTNAAHVESAMMATCAQVEYWIENGENVGSASSFSLGDLSMNFGANGPAKVAPRASQYLNHEGLRYTGISMDSGRRDL
jgi:hypothetical protein